MLVGGEGSNMSPFVESTVMDNKCVGGVHIQSEMEPKQYSFINFDLSTNICPYLAAVNKRCGNTDANIYETF